MNLTKHQLKALDVNRNIIVTAGAGSGKTTILAQKYIHILLHDPHLNVRNILAITFTEKAASEIKDRIFTEINNRFHEHRSYQARLFEILNQFHEAQISTIHTFCSQLLRKYPIEAELRPEFNILDDISIDQLLNQVFRNFFSNENLRKHPKSDYILKALRNIQIQKIKTYFCNIYRKRVNLFTFLNSLVLESTEKFIKEWEGIFLSYNKPLLKPLTEDKLFCEYLEQLIGIDTENGGPEYERKGSLKLAYLHYKENSNRESLEIQHLMKIIRLLTKNDGRAFRKVPGGKKFWGDHGVSLFSKLSEMVAQYAEDLISFDQELEATYSEIHLGLGIILLELLKRIDRTKLKENSLDFDDLQIFTLRLLRTNPDIRDQIRSQYRYILVDEFQDTDSLQSNIISLLSHDYKGNLDNNRLFIVGDPKQSIFAFRNANVKLFQEYQNTIEKQGSDNIEIAVPNVDGEIKSTTQERRGIIPLAQNFRSSEQLIRFFNQTFRSVFQLESEFDIPYQELIPARETVPDQKSCVSLDLFMDDDNEKFDTIQTQAYQISKHIHKVIQSNHFQKFTEENSKPLLSPLDFSDIAVLLRSRTHINKFEQVFREQLIPYQTYRGTGFYQKQEIQDIYYILKSLANPEDDFALLTGLRSNFIGLSDVILFYLSQIKGLNYWQRVQKLHDHLLGNSKIEETFQENFVSYLSKNEFTLQIIPDEKATFIKTVTQYRSWINLAQHGNFSKLLDIIIEELQIRPLLSSQIDYDQKLANLDKLMHYIFEYESSSSVLTLDLLENIQQLILGESKETEAMIMTEEENKVKILTYHSAKGMEFPVVFLPLLERPFLYNQQILTNQNYGFAIDFHLSNTKNQNKPFIYEYLKKQDQKMIDAEEKRLFYVAATRARDFLFLLGLKNPKKNITSPNYLNWLLDIYNISEKNIKHLEDESKSKYFSDFNISVHYVKKKPDYKKFTKQEPKVLTDIDETINDLNLKYQQPIIEKPNDQIYSVTQLMLFRENPNKYFQQYYLNEEQLLVPQYDYEFSREPGGVLWGTAVHKLLENFQYRTPEEDAKKIQQLIPQIGIFDDRKKSEIQLKLQKTIQNFRESKIGQILLNSNPKSEFEIEIKINKFILKGIFDCLYQNRNNIWEIIDFKTNRITEREVTKTAQKYQFQMQAYALLLSEYVTKQQIFPVNIFFLEPMKVFKKEFTLLEIETIRNEVIHLLKDIHKYELRVYKANYD